MKEIKDLGLYFNKYLDIILSNPCECTEGIFVTALNTQIGETFQNTKGTEEEQNCQNAFAKQYFISNNYKQQTNTSNFSLCKSLTFRK